VQATQGGFQWRARAADAWARIGKHDRAAEHWGAIWNQRKSAEIGGQLADNLLRNGAPADVIAARNVLSAPELASDNSLSMRMLRARLKARSGQMLDAATDVADILAGLNSADRAMVGGFMTDLSAMYPRQQDMIAALAKLESRSPFTGYMALQAATIRLRSDETKPQAASALEDLAGNSKDPRIQAAAWAALGTLSYQDAKWEEARQRFQKGLDTDPANPELSNNMAYVLGVKLGRGAEALPHAQKAVAAAPASSGFRDTLGAVYLTLGDFAQANSELTQALNMALNDSERVPVYIHLGSARFGQGDKVEARRNAQQARDLMGTSDALRRAYEDDLKELERKLDGLK
jgi:tetratricopeptide (TPR) repeat protein